MYIKNTHEDEITPSQAVEEAMDIIYTTLIEPIEKDLTQKQATVIALTGAVLKSIGQKADAYDKLRASENQYCKN